MWLILRHPKGVASWDPLTWYYRSQWIGWRHAPWYTLSLPPLLPMSSCYLRLRSPFFCLFNKVGIREWKTNLPFLFVSGRENVWKTENQSLLYRLLNTEYPLLFHLALQRWVSNLHALLRSWWYDHSNKRLLQNLLKELLRACSFRERKSVDLVPYLAPNLKDVYFNLQIKFIKVTDNFRLETWKIFQRPSDGAVRFWRLETH